MTTRDTFFLRLQHERGWDILMLGLLLCLLLVAFLTHDINFPWDLGTYTRALYVDEGFYSDAAQNLVKLGRWDMLHDSRHWPGSPLTALFQSAAFTLFGASIEVARMLSVVLGATGGWALYSIGKARFHPAVSMLLVLASVSTMTYFAVARTAVTDPIAMVMFLMATWVFVRMGNRYTAIPLSLFFAFLAFFSKMYFIFALATMIVLWLAELILLARLRAQEVDRGLLSMVGLSLVAIGLAYLSYRLYFDAEISNYLAINANKKPVFELDRVLRSLKISLQLIPENTKSMAFLYTLAIGISYTTLQFIFTRIVPVRDRSNSLLASLSKINRAEWAMGVFLVSGLLTVGSLKLLKTHYHFFAIIPIAFLAVAMIYHVFPRKLAALVSVTVLLTHMYLQSPAYREWLSRPEPRLIDTVSHNIAAQLQAEYPQGKIPVIGEFSAQLGLYSKRIISIDAKWVPKAVLCERLNYWKPPYHVNVIWNKSYSRRMIKRIDACPSVQIKTKPVLYPAFSGKKDYIALTRISYGPEVENIAPPLSILLLLQ